MGKHSARDGQDGRDNRVPQTGGTFAPPGSALGTPGSGRRRRSPNGPYTEPFTVDYAYGAAQSTAMFTQPLPERWIRFEGLNTADGNREVVIDLYRVAINPAKELSIITDELLKFELSGQVLADLTKPVGGDLGQFGRLVLL